MTFKLCNKRFLQGTLTTLGNYWLVFSIVSSSLRLPLGVHLNKAGEHPIFGYFLNTHKNPKFGRVRQVPIWELGWEFPGWDLSHFAKFGILWVYFFKYPKISKNGNPLFFPVLGAQENRRVGGGRGKRGRWKFQ